MTKLTAEIYLGTDQWGLETIYPITDLLNIQFSGQERSDPSLPSWGIYSNSGSLEMYDKDGTIASLKQAGTLLNSTIRIYLVTDAHEEQIGGFIIKSVSEPEQDYIIKIEFSDTLTHWQKIQMPKFYYPHSSIEDGIGFLDDLYKEVVKYARITINRDSSVEYLFKRMYLPVLILEEGSFWSQMSKICEASACYICCDNQGNPKIYDTRDII